MKAIFDHITDFIQTMTGLDQKQSGYVTLGIVVFVVVLAFLTDWYRKRRNKRLKIITDRVASAVQKMALAHVGTLSRKKAQLVYRDEYGVEHTTAYESELNRFYQTVVWPVIERDMTDIGLAGHSPSHATNVGIVAVTVVKHDMEHPAQLSRVAPDDPIEYESWCAERLKAVGWNARVTKASGDQGADVIADKNGRILVVQCKLYSGDVGNKAVQEVLAARTYYRATDAAVVTPTSFTKSARQLAGVSNVLLLHHNDLSQIDSLVAPAIR
jgi:restriction system protein